VVPSDSEQLEVGAPPGQTEAQPAQETFVFKNFRRWTAQETFVFKNFRRWTKSKKEGCVRELCDTDGLLSLWGRHSSFACGGTSGFSYSSVLEQTLSWYPNPSCTACLPCSPPKIKFQNLCLHGAIPTSSYTQTSAQTLPNALPLLQPTSARRTSGHCIGIFTAVNALSVGLKEACSLTYNDVGWAFYAFPPPCVWADEFLTLFHI